MASALRAMRLASRTHFLRPAPTTSRNAPIAQRSYPARTSTPTPADPDKPAEEAEQAQEDLSGAIVGEDPTDPNMNGNYPDPGKISALPIKRQFRDPYGDWWDKQERRNYGEPVHEDNDILGIFSPEVYTHVTPAWGAVQFSCFLLAVGTLLGVTYKYYPDKPSVPRTFPGGLEAELGGPRGVRAWAHEDEAEHMEEMKAGRESAAEPTHPV